MRDLIRIAEAFWGAEDVDSPYFQGEVAIYADPSPIEFGKLLREHGFLRGFLDLKAKEIFVWQGNVLHGEINAPGECFVTWDNGECHVQPDSEAAVEAFMDEDGNAPDVSVEFLTAYISGLRCMRPLLNNASLRVTFR